MNPGNDIQETTSEFPTVFTNPIILLFGNSIAAKPDYWVYATAKVESDFVGDIVLMEDQGQPMPIDIDLNCDYSVGKIMPLL